MFLFKVEFQLVIILNDTVVHYGNSTQPIKVRVCFDICFVAMGCPPCVSYRNIVVVASCSLDGHPLDAVASEPLGACKLGGLEYRLVCLIVRDRDDSTGVVPTRFKDF